MFNHLTCFIQACIFGLLACAWVLAWVAYIENMLWVLITLTRSYRFVACTTWAVVILQYPLELETTLARVGAYVVSYDKFILPLSQFNLLTTTNSAIPLYTCTRVNPVTENNRSGSLITMRRLS